MLRQNSSVNFKKKILNFGNSEEKKKDEETPKPVVIENEADPTVVDPIKIKQPIATKSTDEDRESSPGRRNNGRKSVLLENILKIRRGTHQIRELASRVNFDEETES